MFDVIQNALLIYPLAMALYAMVEGGLYGEIKAKAGAVKITTLGAAERLWSLVLAARDESVSIAELSFSEDGSVAQRGIATKPFCRILRYLPVSTEAVATASDGCMQVVKRFSRAFVNVRFTAAALQYIRGTFYRVGDDWFVKNPGSGMVVCLTSTMSDSDARHAVFNKDGELNDGVLVYNDLDAESHATLSATAGQKKQYVLTLFCDNLPGFNPRHVHYLMTYGLSEMAATGAEKSQKDMASGSNRLSQFEAPNTPGINLHVFAVFMGKFGKDYRDGFAFISARFVAKLFTSLSNGRYLVTAKAVLGMLLQVRPYLCKLMAETVRTAYLNHYLDRNGLGKASGNRVYINRDALARLAETNPEEYRRIQHDFNRACDKDKSSPYWGKLVVVYGDGDRRDDIDFMTDLNGLKATFDLRMKSTLNILSMSHDTHSVEDGATISQQLLQSLLIVNFRKTVRFVMKSFIRLVRGKLERLDSAEAGKVHADELDDPQFGQLLVKMVPHIATKWYFPLLKTVVNATIEGLVHRAARQSIPTKGCYCKIITDPAADFGVQILKYNIDGNGLAEVLLPAAERNGIKKGIGIKYPKQHFREYLKFRVLGIEEYVARVRACDELTAYEKALLIDKVRHLSAGGIVTPAYELLKNMLAGMDFDGDALIAYLDKELYEILDNQEPLAVVMDEDDPAAVEIEEEEVTVKEVKVAVKSTKAEASSFKASFLG